MAAPLHLGGDIVGFLGVDNPRANTNTLLVLQAVSSQVKIVPVGVWPESRRILLGIHNIEEIVAEHGRLVLDEAGIRADVCHSGAEALSMLEVEEKS